MTDPDKLLKAIERGVKLALCNMGRRWDDEYLSQGYVAGVEAVIAFRQWRSKRDVYEFVTWCVIREVKSMVQRECERAKKVAYVNPDTLLSVRDDRPASVISEPGDERLVAKLASGDPVTGPTDASRKKWDIRQHRLARLRKTYG